jgi:hypothetical protein
MSLLLLTTTVVSARPVIAAEVPDGSCALRAAAEGTCGEVRAARGQDPAPPPAAPAAPPPPRRRDSIRNGAIIGGVIGLAFGLLGSSIADCPGENPGGSCPGTRVGGVIVSTALWTGIGAGVDAMVTDRTTGAGLPGRGAPRGRMRALPPRPSVAMTVRW